MRPGPNKRSRGRNNGNNPNGGGNPNSGPHHNNNRPRMPHRVQTFDSNGPNVKIRGNAYQVFERYIALAREAVASGDRIAAESLYQHAEHYFRVMNAAGDGHPQGPPRPTTPADLDLGENERSEGEDEEVRSVQQQQSSMPSDEQPSSF
jgi:hypothetical protein